MAGIDADDAARTAVYALLTDPALVLARPFPAGAARTVPVQEEAGTTGLPYLALGASTATPSEAHGQFGWLVRLSVHAWSEYQGFAEIGALRRAVTERLHRRTSGWPAALDAWQDISMMVAFQTSLRDENPKYRHGVLDVEVRLTQKAS